jgi:hypothetical protein
MYDLGLFVGWMEILRDFMDYWDYMCSSAEILIAPAIVFVLMLL